MGKILETYEGLTAQQIINRASNTCTLTLAGSTVNCTDITLSKVRTVLNHTDNSLAGLCSSANVNVWSGFSPVEWYVVGDGTVASRIKTPYSLGSFAGYNHNAEAASLDSYVTRVAYNTSTTNISFYADIHIGEVNWSALGCGYVKFIIKDTGGIIGSSITPITIGDSTIMNIALDLEVYNWGNNKSLTGELWLCDSGGIAQAMVPNTAVWNITGKYYTNGVTSTIDGATGTSTILVNGYYTLNFTVTGTPDVTVSIFNLFDEVVATETLALQTTTRSFTGYLSTPLQNGYYIRFNILSND